MRGAMLVCLVLLTACGDGMTDAERKAKEDADVAFVENLEPSDPPPEPIDPQPIGYPEMEEYQISGAHCAFAPGTSLGAIVIAEESDAWMKLSGKMLRLASDSGSAKLPFGTWSKYDGKEYSVHLRLDREAGDHSGGETVNYPANLRIDDPYGQLVYTATGAVQCGP